MVASAFTVANIKPSLGIDSSQRLIFGLNEAPEPLGSLKLDNVYIPLLGGPAQTNFEIRNNVLSGYRWIHTTGSTETYGSFKLQKFLTGSPTGIDLITFNDDGTFIIPGIDNAAKYILQQPSVTLPNAQSLSALATGLVKNTTTTGVLSIAAAGTDYYSPSNPTVINDDSNLGAGNNNFSIGMYALAAFAFNSGDGINNVAVAPFALNSLVTGSGNTAVGTSAGGLLVTGSNNCFFGNFAGNNHTNYNDCLFLGYNADASVNNLTNAIALGYNAVVSTSNALVLGNGCKIGIGTSTPLYDLDVHGVISANSNNIVNVADPSISTHAANKNYVDSQISSTIGSLNVPKLGIGVTPTVNGRIQYANTTMVNKLSFFNNTGNDYNQSGLGYESVGTAYHAPTGTAHNFYLGSSTTIPLSVNALGLTIAQLRPIDADYRRIMLYDELENLHQIYNIGIKTLDGTHHAIHCQVSNYQAAFTWAYGVNSSSSYELMRLDNNALQINNGKLTILESANLTSWNLTPISDGTFSIQSTAISANKFTFTSTTSSSSFSILNVNSSGVARFRANGGVSGDYVELAYDASVDYSYINLGGSSNDRLEFRANGTGLGAYLSTGLLGLGTITPTLGKLQINGGVQNLANEETALHVRSALNNVKIELQATAGSGRLWEIRAANNGGFDITDRTGSRTLYAIDSNANHTFNTVGTLFAKRSRGYLSMSGNATAAASVAATWVKIAGTTTLNGVSNLFDMPANNRLRYTGTPTLLNGTIQVSFTFNYATSVATKIGFGIFKNGSLLADTPKYVTNNNTNFSMIVSLSAATSFATNDYIEIYFNSPNGGVNLTATDLSITVE